MTPRPFVALTYNVGNGLASPERLALALRASQADLIGLQELTVSQAAALDATLTDVYPYRALFGRGIPGKGLLSRFPFIELKHLEFHPHRPDLHVVVERGGAPMHVLVVHPPPPAPWTLNARGRQFRRLKAMVDMDDPVLLLGDLNMMRWDQQYRMLRAAGLRDAFFTAGRGPRLTYPTRRGTLPLIPMVRLDYILHSSELTALDAWVGTDAGSDHLPLFARLA